MKNQIEIVPQLEIATMSSGLLPERAIPLVEVFKPYAVSAAELFALADEVTDSEPKKARAIRLDLAKVRIGVEKLRKAEKSESLKLGSAVDAVAKVIFNVIEPYESKMDAIEKAEEIAAAKAKAERAELRRQEIAPFGTVVDNLLLEEMNPDAWASFVSGTKAAHEKKLADEAAAVEKSMREKEERKEAERKLREENERLQKVAAEENRLRLESEAKAKADREAAEKKVAADRAESEAKVRAERKAAQAKADAERAEIERKAKADREVAEAIARKEREARKKLEAEQREREQAEQKRLKAEAAAKAKAARAPDRDKLLAFLKEFTTIKSPELKSDESKAILGRFTAAYGAAIKAALREVDAL